MIVYFRESLADEEERNAVNGLSYLKSVTSLGEAWAYVQARGKTEELVIPRYSLEPYTHDMFREFDLHGLVPINTPRQYNWCKSLCDWYEDLEGFTFKTWFELPRVPEGIPLVVKGETNSRKNLWNTHMFAQNKQEATQVMCRLQDDTMLGMQSHVFREYRPLKRLGEGPHGLPITNEWRTFCLGGKILEWGFYWHSYMELEPPQACYPELFVQEIANKIQQIHGDRFFYVLDVAQLETGDWILVEVNSGEMSGLACCDPDVLYTRLQSELIQLALKKTSWL